MPSAPNPPTVRPDSDGTVLKKLAPGAPGTHGHLRRHGADLVCVRYREATAADGSPVRRTTVELVVERRPLTPRVAAVRVGYQETALRAQVKAAGGIRDARCRLWRLPLPAARRLGLQDRGVPADA